MSDPIGGPALPGWSQPNGAPLPDAVPVVDAREAAALFSECVAELAGHFGGADVEARVGARVEHVVARTAVGRRLLELGDGAVVTLAAVASLVVPMIWPRRGDAGSSQEAAVVDGSVTRGA